jgi:hypothetical protein
MPKLWVYELIRLGIVWKKDYSVLVFLSTLIGLLILLFVLQQELFPGLINLT